MKLLVSGSSLYKIYNMKLFNNSIYLIIRLFYTYMYIPSCRSVAPDLKNFGLMTPSSSIRFISQTGSYRPAADKMHSCLQIQQKNSEYEIFSLNLRCIPRNTFVYFSIQNFNYVYGEIFAGRFIFAPFALVVSGRI